MNRLHVNLNAPWKRQGIAIKIVYVMYFIRIDTVKNVRGGEGEGKKQKHMMSKHNKVKHSM